MNEEIKNIKALLKVISSASPKVFIVGHNNPDLDSLASAIGLQTLCESLGKEAYIIIDEPEATIEPIVKKVRDANIATHNIINKEGYELLKDDDSTLIVTDTNKSNLVAVEDCLDDFKNIIVIDHHDTGEKTIRNASTFITTKVSSASEIVSQLLMQAKVACSSDVYTYLYGGIILDTKRFDKNVGERTHDIASRLLDKGADAFAAKELFLADFDEDKIIYNLIFNGTLLKAYEYSMVDNYTVAFTLNREKPRTIYRKESIAKAADRMLKYRIEAAIAMGYIDEETISISARSKGRMDVGKIMAHIGGGGNCQNAGAKVNISSLSSESEGSKEVEALEKLEEALKLVISHGMTVDGEITSAIDSAVISAPKQYVKKTEQP